MLQQNCLMDKFKYLYGASGHCKVVIDILRSNNVVVAGIFDDCPAVDQISGIPVLKATFIKPSISDLIIICIGDNFLRKKIVSKISIPFFTAIHNTAILSVDSKIGIGTVIMANAVINSSTDIGEHCIVNSGAVIEHDCKIDDFCHISPNAALAGNVSLGKGTHVGIGACIIQGVKIGKWVTVGAGAVVIRDIPDFAIVVGNPGKIIKYKEVNE